MPNQSSDAGHVPERTCVVCRKRFEQKELLGFYLLGNDPVFDIGKAVQTRKKYVCHSEECLSGLDKWLARHLKKAGRVQEVVTNEKKTLL
jgi:predicted RNA-binding protein YlxR (DUF448 family)